MPVKVIFFFPLLLHRRSTPGSQVSISWKVPKSFPLKTTSVFNQKQSTFHAKWWNNIHNMNLHCNTFFLILSQSYLTWFDLTSHVSKCQSIHISKFNQSSFFFLKESSFFWRQQFPEIKCIYNSFQKMGMEIRKKTKQNYQNIGSDFLRRWSSCFWVFVSVHMETCLQMITLFFILKKIG